MMAAIQLPEHFGRYRIIKLLGQGAMGSVYLAHDTQLDRRVALKVPLLAQEKGPQIVARFYQEARAAATIHHPHVCPIYDVGEIDGIHYLTMAFIEGKPLEEWVESGKHLSQRQIATLGRKIAEALSEAHKRGVIHRDLKPANIMIDKRGEPIVMDFGLARRATDSEDEKRLTQFGTVIGSPAYMSPEQIRGETDSTGPATDVFSLGVILYELIARQLPFDGDTVGAVHAKILMDEPAPLRTLVPDVDPVLEAACLKALAKKSDERHPSMAHMAAALKGYLDHKPPAVVETTSPPAATRPAGTRPTSAIHASDLGGRSMVVVQQEREERAGRNRPKRKKKSGNQSGTPVWVWIGGGAVALAAVIGLVAALWPHKKPETATANPPADTQTPTPPRKEPPTSVPPTPVVTTSNPTPQPAPAAAPPLKPVYQPVGEFRSLLTPQELLNTTHTDALRARVWGANMGEIFFNVTDTANQEDFMSFRGNYSDFVLRLEFNLVTKGARSGVLIRNAVGGNSLRIQIVDDSSLDAKANEHAYTGALFLHKLNHRAELKPLGQWNTMEIDVKGQALRVTVNGTETLAISLDEPAITAYFGKPAPTTGALVLHAQTGDVRFRKFEVQEFKQVKP